ncbi:MAG: hypothetical protein RL038_715 [Actinomycetota bacterium]
MKSWPTPAAVELPANNRRISVFDSVSKQLVVTPSDFATLYVCGITPYDATHMGHASTYLAFDLLNRAWRDAGVDVKFAENVTDIDDPLLERATATKVDWQELAVSEIDLFRSDMTALRIIPPDFYISVTEHMNQIIGWIENLIAKDLAYKVENDWYFDSRLTDSVVQTMQGLVEDPLSVFAERGGDPNRAGKRNPFDALLWRSERAGEPAWPAPFGAGRPGWHIECLAIAKDMLGETITVQGGGSDLLFPHHFMCELQGQAATNNKFASSHVHAGLVSYQGEKMSKSRGNLVFVSKLLAAGTDPMAIRLAILRHHYRSEWEWTDELLDQAKADLARWRTALSGYGTASATNLLNQIRDAVANDLDTPRALKAVDDFVSSTLAGDRSDLNGSGLAARALDRILGIAL